MLRLLFALLITVALAYHGLTSDDVHAFVRNSNVLGHHHDANNVEYNSDSVVHWAVGLEGEQYSAGDETGCTAGLQRLVDWVNVRLEGVDTLTHVAAQQQHRASHCADGAVLVAENANTHPQITEALREATLQQYSGLQWFERQFPHRRKTRDLVADLRREPLWHAQWHLHNANEPASDYWTRTGLAPNHLHVQEAWQSGVFGRGVVVAVVDDGLDRQHAEFEQSYSARYSYDFDNDRPDPSPYVRDAHGTEAAALIAARANQVCGAGVAPLSILAGIRLIAEPVSDAVEARGLTYFDSAISIYSNSWGPPDDGARLDAPGPLTQRAMQRAVEEGRNGFGVVYVWAAGNGKQRLDSCNYDGFANSRLVVPVCAVDFFARETYYSEWCSALLVCAPSSGERGPLAVQGIATAEPHGSYGNTPGDCVSDFGGTSAAAPMVAGVVALMLEARPELGWRDVQHVLARTAVHNDAIHQSWMRNAAGLWVSHSYGFGVVNASAAVERARVWELLPNKNASETSLLPLEELPVSIPDELLNTGRAFHFNVTERGLVEFVELYFTMSHPRRGDMELLLYSPAGTTSELASPHFDSNPNFNNWRFGSRIPFAEQMQGVWSLVVRDALPNRQQGSVLGVTLIVYSF